MALNRHMHPRNRYKDNRPDFTRLAEKYPEFAKHVSVNLAGNTSLDFHDPESLRSLTCTLLKEDFGLDIELPLDRLIPTVPLRLNYIHWIEDLLQEAGYNTNTDIYGMDIGCGASCIYPILGCQMNGWHYVTSEVDELSLRYAKDNVKRNNLEKNITVLPSTGDTLIQAIVKASPSPPQSVYHFTMCNPPFFGNLMEAQGIMSRTMERPDPMSISTASEVEMIYQGGGEVDFVKRMIVESLQLREQVVWYTSMVGKKSSIGALKEELIKHKVRNVTTAEFCQGRTMRWGIAWTFHDDINVLPPSKRRKNKQRPPLIIPVSDRFLTRAVDSMRSDPSCSTTGHTEKICAVGHATKQIFNELQITFVVQPSSRKVIKLHCTAQRNTWANQRRRRRQKERLKQGHLLDKKPLDINTEDANGTTSVSLKRLIEPIHPLKDGENSKGVVATSSTTSVSLDPLIGPVHTLNNGHSSSKVVDASSTTSVSLERLIGPVRPLNDGQSSRDVIEASCPSSVSLEPLIGPVRPQHGIKHNNNIDPIAQSICVPSPSVSSCTDKTDTGLLEGDGTGKHCPSRPLMEGMQGSTSIHQDNAKFHLEGTQKIASAHLNPDKNQVEGIQKNSSGYQNTDKSKVEGTQTNTSVHPNTDKSQNEGTHKNTSDLSNADKSQEALFQCSAVVAIIEGKVNIEMTWLDGSSREAMHQVGQYIKNKFNR